MNRRTFLHTFSAMTAATTLTTYGAPALLASGPLGQPRKKRRVASNRSSNNIFAEPAAIEPITGFLPKFTPVDKGTMRDAFSARYALVACHGSAAKSKNTVVGAASLVITFADATCTTIEVRQGVPSNTLRTAIECDGEYHAVSHWTLDSSVEGIPEAHFLEKGTWDGKTMVVKSKSWTQQRSTGKLLIGRWALLPLLASGKLKSRTLTFDLLDDSTLRPNQTLRHTGQIEIPIAGGSAKMECYAQTGSGVVPTHYLVDQDGRVQLITMSTVNWALTNLSKVSRKD